ncbi:MAG: GAF domain-containing protein [Prolixibacteraceae bacterium]|nr:GAF domain-containing protein [Prolixibacteraceae bacterium]
MVLEDILGRVDAIITSNTHINEVLLDVCKLLAEKVEHYDWVGFYVLNTATNKLELGPFVGKPTEHTAIPVGKGVCGQVAQNKQTMIVQDVSKMDNYIACSIEVQSEIVVPVLKNNAFVAEIDIDSHAPAPFSSFDVTLLEAICAKLSNLF